MLQDFIKHHRLTRDDAGHRIIEHISGWCRHQPLEKSLYTKSAVKENNIATNTKATVLGSNKTFSCKQMVMIVIDSSTAKPKEVSGELFCGEVE